MVQLTSPPGEYVQGQPRNSSLCILLPELQLLCGDIVQAKGKFQEELDAIKDSMVKVSESEKGVSVYVPADQVDYYDKLDPNNPEDA